MAEKYVISKSKIDEIVSEINEVRNTSNKMTLSEIKASITNHMRTPADDANLFYGPEDLGTSVTPSQIAAIKDGTFIDENSKHMWIGSAWNIDGIEWMIHSVDKDAVRVIPDKVISYVNLFEFWKSTKLEQELAESEAIIESAFGDLALKTTRTYYMDNNTYPSVGTLAGWPLSEFDLFTYGICSDEHYSSKLSGGQGHMNSLFAYQPTAIMADDIYWIWDAVRLSDSTDPEDLYFTYMPNTLTSEEDPVGEYKSSIPTWFGTALVKSTYSGLIGIRPLVTLKPQD